MLIHILGVSTNITRLVVGWLFQASLSANSFDGRRYHSSGQSYKCTVSFGDNEMSGHWNSVSALHSNQQQQ
jgi:hypothetical protein